MDKARLQRVVNRLRKVRIEIALGNAPEFRMADWAVLEEPGVFKGKKNMSCATSACAIGHAAHLFRADGFKLVVSKDDNSKLIPYYKKLENFDAVSKFFKISDHAAEYLFHPSHYYNDPDVSEVADRIEDFIHGMWDSNFYNPESE